MLFRRRLNNVDASELYEKSRDGTSSESGKLQNILLLEGFLENVGKVPLRNSKQSFMWVQ